MIRNCCTAMLLLLLVGNKELSAQIDTSFSREPLLYNKFLSVVVNQNLAYAAEKYNINIAQANLEAAKVFADPNLSFGWVDNGQKRMRTGYGFNSSVNWLMELGGKRKARIQVAKSRLELTSALVNDFFRNLRSDATTAYLQAMLQKKLLQVNMESYRNMLQLAKADSVRFKLGEIKEIDARQTRLEAGVMLNTVFQNEASWKAALARLKTFMGKQADTLYEPSSLQTNLDRDFDLTALIDNAITTRTDIIAAMREKDFAASQVNLARSNRVIDIGLSMGVAGNATVLNQISPAPSTSVVAAGITVPLRISSKYKGELQAAGYGMLQASTRFDQAVVEAKSEVTVAYNNYLSARKQLKQFETGLLYEAQKTLEGKMYSYQRGETNLLEVLIAQRTYNSLRQNYYEAWNALGISLVEVERAAGIWDIRL